ncbi:hypothetical protein F4782DRAFT_47498 [Xylaria castorea]|nr:hypothetical protein F4782DRAFT_47498 [Xylaria castorea]
MTQIPVMRQLTDSTERFSQTSTCRTTMTGDKNTSSERRGGRPNGSATLAESNLRSLPTWIPLSDWLTRDDDPFPYGKQRANSSSSRS